MKRAGHELWYQYDVDGNRIAAHHPTPSGVARDALDYTSTWAYDAVGRVRTSMPAIRDQQANRARYKIGSTMYQYGESGRAFGAGRLTSAVTNYGTTTYDYTVEGNVATETRNLFVAPDGVTMISNGTTKLTYNVAGQPVTITHPDDPTAPTQTRYSYDALGRPAKAEVLGAGGAWLPLAAFARNKAGLVTSRYSTSPSTVEQGFTYDAAGRVISHEINGIQTGGAAVTVLGGEGLVYAQDGNVQGVTDRASNRQLAYKYDDRQQLVSAFVPNTNDYQATFAYSPSGKVTGANILSTLAGTQVVSRNVAYEFAAPGDPTDPAAPRRLVTPTGSVFATMTYDASGNVTQRTANGVTMSFTYDGEDAQREAINATTGEREVYFYDHKGERIMTYRPARNGKPATLVNRIGTTEITTDTTGARSTVTDVVLGAHPVARIVDHAGATPQKLYHGVLGSLLVATDASRVMRARYGYGPYGEVLYTEGPDAAVFDRTYEDKARDKMTGLSYFGARYYDPLTLGWTQADPLYRFVPDMAYTEPRRMGLYTYSMNNPLRYVDPDGRDPTYTTGYNDKTGTTTFYVVEGADDVTVHAMVSFVRNDESSVSAFGGPDGTVADSYTTTMKIHWDGTNAEVLTYQQYAYQAGVTPPRQLQPPAESGNAVSVTLQASPKPSLADKATNALNDVTFGASGPANPGNDGSGETRRVKFVKVPITRVILPPMKPSKPIPPPHKRKPQKPKAPQCTCSRETCDGAKKEESTKSSPTTSAASTNLLDPFH